MNMPYRPTKKRPGGGGGGGAGGGVGVTLAGVLSPSEFEAAVREQAAVRHAYLDCLEATLPACQTGFTSPSDRGEYEEAARFDAIEKSARAILAGIAKPRSKAEIRASLNGEIIARIQEIEGVQFRQNHQGWQLEKTSVEGEIESA
jgi:hypothetical protein